MPPADWIHWQNMQDPGPVTHTCQEGQSDDFSSHWPCPAHPQLNMEGISAAKHSVIRNIAERHNVDVICLQDTHGDAFCASHFTISGFDLISYTLHAKQGRAVYARNDLLEVSQQPSTCHCDVVKVGNYNIANVYQPPSDPWEDTSTTVLPFLYFSHIRG